ncbi:MAG: energy-coupling factor ABC transporter ATP-binding protein [Lachnospiraceae bacterium]|nr:energy-coupling factor ABC transporter ATP-binding protein [Lachnospiraceae bacterium]
MAHITIENLSFSYPVSADKLALDHITLDIPQGQYVTLCGRSGSGKSTLLNQLKTVLTPNGNKTGAVYLDGVPLEQVDLRTQAMTIGYVMQDPDSQIVTDKVWHELAFGLENLGFDQNTMRTRVAEMASYFGIQGWFHRDVADLSGGQKQLLNLASIMAMQPGVLILDEPTSQLDPIAASDFLNTVRKINLELGTTVIITEHRLEDIFHASDKVVVMEQGKIIVQDTPKAVGKYLKANGSEMFAAMPAPVQIFYGVAEKAKLNTDDLNSVPLTVREGRTWLTGLLGEKKELVRELDPEEKQQYQNTDKQDAAIAFKDVWFRYEKDLPDILKGTTFEVPKNSLFAIVGGNGTGKSTSLKTICRILKPYRGKILVDGKKLDSYKAEELFKGQLAMLPQDPKSLFVKTTVREELEEMLGVKEAAWYEKEVEKYGPENVPLHEKIKEIAEECDIFHLLNMHPYDLSGGEQQRTALAKVLLTEPKILLLDEPTKGLDNFFKIHFADILNRLKDRGVTILMVSHDVEFCARYADLVGMFFDGDLITTNTPAKFFGQNSFYTTAANRMSRHLFHNAITDNNVIDLCNMNLE